MNFIGEPEFSKILLSFKKLSRLEYLDAIEKLQEERHEFVRYFKSKGYDAIICPAWPSPAFVLGMANQNMIFGGFMSLFNVLDMPCGTIPVALCENNNYTKTTNEHYQRVMEQTMKDEKGLPIALMVATLPKQDEKCLRLVREIDEINKFSERISHEIMKKPGIGLKLNK